MSPVLAVKLSGSRSKNSVRSSRVSSVIRRPRPLWDDELVERLQVGGLSAQRRAVIDELDGQLAGREIELQEAPHNEQEKQKKSQEYR